MNVDLVQPFFQEPPTTTPNDGWDVAALEQHLRASAGADLVVFPEDYPWPDDERPYPSLAEARRTLKGIADRTKRTFLAGGIVMEGPQARNVAMLASPTSDDVPVYRKRLLWRSWEEPLGIIAGDLDQDAVFMVGGRAVIPLICADVYGEQGDMTGEPGRRRERVAALAAQRAHEHPGAIIVVPANAGGPLEARWTTLLQELADRAEADVLFCNFAGRFAGFGDGGSGLFRRGAAPDRLGNEGGVYLYRARPGSSP